MSRAGLAEGVVVSGLRLDAGLLSAARLLFRFAAPLGLLRLSAGQRNERPAGREGHEGAGGWRE